MNQHRMVHNSRLYSFLGKLTGVFLFIMVLMDSLPLNAQQPSSRVHVLLKGKITDGQGKPLPKVPVTDGTNIVYTDQQGRYRLQSTNTSMFVYITVPAGYEIPAVNQMAAFYRQIKPVNGLFNADFVLHKMKQNDHRHFTILWADPQINTPEEAAQLMETAVADTRRLASSLKLQAPVHGIAAGDLSLETKMVVKEYKQAVKESGIPFFHVLGNHDMDINVRTDERSDSFFRKHMGPTWYSFNRGKAHYIVLDNVFYYSDGYNYMGYITEQQFKWLEQDLQTVQPGSLVFVSMHISAYTHEKARTKAAADHPGDVTMNRRFLYDLLKPYKVHFLTGHTHYNENHEHGNIFEHIHAAICGAWWISPLCGDGTPRGYGVYEIDGNDVSWYYKTIGREKSYQMQVYNRGVYKKKPLDIAANVWNYDQAWKIEWYEDGIFKGNMRRETDYDANVVEFLTGPHRPAKYPWAQPLLTDHLFFATPAANASEAEVVVTDRFGNQYKEKIQLNKPGN